MQNKPTTALASSPRKNLGFVKLRRGLAEHLHRSRMSPNAVVVFLRLLIAASFVRGRSGCVSANIDDLMGWLGLSRATVCRAKDELIKKGYLEFVPAPNQHGVGLFKIPKYEEFSDSAHHDSELSAHSAQLSAHYDFELSDELSSGSGPMNQKNLSAPKNVEEVKKGKTTASKQACSVIDPLKTTAKTESSSLKEKAVEVENQPISTTLPGYAEARLKFRKVTGKSLGDPGRFTNRWLELVAENNVEWVVRAVEIFALSVEPRINDIKYPLYIFFEGVSGWMAEAGEEPSGTTGSASKESTGGLRLLVPPEDDPARVARPRGRPEPLMR